MSEQRDPLAALIREAAWSQGQHLRDWSAAEVLAGRIRELVQEEVRSALSARPAPEPERAPGAEPVEEQGDVQGKARSWSAVFALCRELGMLETDFPRSEPGMTGCGTVLDWWMNVRLLEHTAADVQNIDLRGCGDMSAPAPSGGETR